MYVIANKRNGKFVCGTDYRYHPPHQRLSDEQALTFDYLEHAETAFKTRRCGKDYEIRRVIKLETERVG